MSASPAEIKKRAKKIKLIVLDVDGVLTDGKIIVNDEGVESKNFNVRDGMAIALAEKRGMAFAVISGRYSQVVEHRCQELKIHEIHQNVHDKVKVFETILQKLEVTAESSAFIGDDINDMPLLEKVGFSATPSDADESVKGKTHWVSKFPGGGGAVREMVELIMTSQDKWGW